MKPLFLKEYKGRAFCDTEKVTLKYEMPRCPLEQLDSQINSIRLFFFFSERGDLIFLSDVGTP